MLIALVVAIVIIGAAVVGSIYSGFLVFYSNFSESENYHKAYYASISALERGELVSKQRDPGYLGSGGFILGEGTGSRSNGGSDSLLSGFSYLSGNFDSSTIFWDVNSRNAGRIPATGKGNVESLLAYHDSSHPDYSSYNYNIMDYENAEIFLLYYDVSGGSPYNKVSCWSGNSFDDTNCWKTEPSSIAGNIRLPKLLRNATGFSELDEDKAVVEYQQASVPGDDSIVDWQIRGIYIDGGENYPFTVFSTQKHEGRKNVNYQEDTVFRESYLNETDGLNFDFGSSWNPLGSYVIKPTVISSKESEIIRSNFSEIFRGTSNFYRNQIRFSLLNLVKGKEGKIYPYLEYYINFGGEQLPDKYYTIVGEGDFADYHVKTVVPKPTVKESILGNFTTVF